MMTAATDFKDRPIAGRPKQVLLPLSTSGGAPGPSAAAPPAAAARRPYPPWMQRQDTRGGRTLAFVLATFLLVVGFTALLRSRNMGGGGGAGGSAEQQQIAGGRESLAAAEAAAPQVAGTSAYSQELDQLDDDDPPLTHMFSASVGAPPALQEPPPGPIRMGGEGLEAFAEAAVRVAVDRTVAYVFVGYSMREFAVNWLLHASAVGVRGVVVGALDLAVADFLMRDPRINNITFGVITWPSSDMTLQDYGTNIEPAFQKMAAFKFAPVSAWLKMGTSVLVADVDVIMLRNPLTYFNRFPEPDIFAAFDGMEKKPTMRERLGLELNIGLMFMRASPNCSRFIERYYREMVDTPDFATAKHEWDQGRFNRMVREGQAAGPDGAAWVWGYNGSLRLHVLDNRLFADGPFYFGARGPQSENVRPYTVHTTWTWVGQNFGKAARMREFGFWVADGPEYYAPANGILSFDPAVDVGEDGTVRDGDAQRAAAPSGEAAAVGDGVRPSAKRLVVKEGAPPPPPPQQMGPPHDEILDRELPALLAAWAVANLLDRTLVLPHFVCGADAPFPGPRPQYRGPYSCPMDYVLDPKALDREGILGRVREPGFLESPAVPKATRRSRVDVILVSDVGERPPAGSPAAAHTGAALDTLAARHADGVVPTCIVPTAGVGASEIRRRILTCVTAAAAKSNNSAPPPLAAETSGSKPTSVAARGGDAAAAAVVPWVHIRFAHSSTRGYTAEAQPPRGPAVNEQKVEAANRAGATNRTEEEDAAARAEQLRALSSAEAADAVLKALTAADDNSATAAAEGEESELRGRVRDAVGRLSAAVTRLHEFRDRWGRRLQEWNSRV